jgi:hypothetical protein
MLWDEIYDQENRPSLNDIEEFIGTAYPLWNQLTGHIEETYKTKPEISYSSCSAQPGWNIKYKKSGKSLCTLYPMEGYFIALVVIGGKEEDEVRIGMETGLYCPYLKELYDKTTYLKIGRWLMIEVRNQETLRDIKSLIEIRVKRR